MATGVVRETSDEASGAPGSAWGTEFSVHRGSFLPLHRQIHELVHREIVEGRLDAGTRLPPEAELARRWGVSLAPVRQALVDLATEGYIDRGRGRGTFVRRPKFDEKLSILSSFTDGHGGERPDLQRIYAGLVPPPPDVAAALSVRGCRVVLIRRLAHLEGLPVALLSAYLDPVRFPDIASRDLDGGSLYRTLSSVYGVDLVRAESVIEAVNATDEDAAALGVGTGAMVLRSDSVTYDGDDVAVEFSQILYRVERFRFHLESHRKDDRVVHFPSDARRGAGRG